MNEWLRILLRLGAPSSVFRLPAPAPAPLTIQSRMIAKECWTSFCGPVKLRFDFDSQLWFHLHCDRCWDGWRLQWMWRMAWGSLEYLNDLGSWDSCLCDNDSHLAGHDLICACDWWSEAQSHQAARERIVSLILGDCWEVSQDYQLKFV